MQKDVYAHLYSTQVSQLAVTCSKLTMETLEQSIKYVKSQQ